MPVQKKTKIFCTMGPACWDVPTLLTLIDAGMNTARLNFSHGDHEAHGATLKRVREANAQRPDKHIAILLDTKGPEIRTGFFQEKCGGKIHLKAGQALEITTDYSYKGDESKIACTYEKLPTSVKPGSTILIADGSLVLIAWDESDAPEERYVAEAAHGAAVAAVTVAEGGLLISCADDCSAATWDFVSDDVVDGVAV